MEVLNYPFTFGGMELRSVMKKVLFLLILASCSSTSKKENREMEIAENIPAVTIGTQTWSKTNLSVDTFLNGDTIPQAKTSDEWNAFVDAEEPAWCYFDFDSTNNALHGKLYNWYAANDTRGIAPKGWRVATNEDWELLIQTTGGKNEAGTKLKAKTGWEDLSGIPVKNLTDEFGFSAVPTGELHRDGVFSSLESMGVWWTSTSYDGPVRQGQTRNNLAWDVIIWYAETMPMRLNTFTKKGSGAIRCVRND